MKKLAITGANGFVGSNLAIKLSADYDVVCLVRSNSDLQLLPENANIVKIDYDDLDAISAVLNDCDVLIHGAALTRARDWRTFKKINIDLTQNLLRLSGDLQQFIFISSQAAAGPAASREAPVLEEDVCHPVSMYGKSKLQAEMIIRQQAAIPWTIIRPVSVFGPGDRDFLYYFKLVSRHFAPLIGFKEKIFNFIYIDELIELIAKTVLNPKAANETFFAANSNTYSMDQFIRAIEAAVSKKSLHLPIPLFLLYPAALAAEFFSRISGKPPLINRQKIKEFRQNNWIVDTQKASSLLAFETTQDLTAPLQQTYKWYLEKGWL